MEAPLPDVFAFHLAVRGAQAVIFASGGDGVELLPWHEFNESLVEESAWDVKQNRVKSLNILVRNICVNQAKYFRHKNKMFWKKK